MSGERQAVKLLNALKAMQNKPQDTLLYGTITSINPLEVKINDDLVLPEKHFIVSKILKPINVKIPHTHEYNGSTELASTDMQITTVGQATTTVVDPKHKHDIKAQVTEDVHKSGTDFEEYITIEIEKPLDVGDKVLLFAFNSFTMFYIAERVE